MAQHPTARRVHRAETSDDALTARLLELATWAQSHARILTIALVVLVLGITVGLYVRNYRADVRNRAEMELAVVRQTALSGNHALAIRDLEAFVTRFDGTRAAEEGRLLLAQAYLADGQHQNALNAVQPLSRAIGKGLGTSAAFLEAAAYEASNQPEKAEVVYLRIADRARYSYERQDALDAAARIRMERGDAAGAAALYERLVAMTQEGTAERAVYEMRLAEARASAQ